MNETEKLLLDIETLRDSIRQNWADLSVLPVTADESKSIHCGIESLQSELEALLKRLWALKSEDPN